MHLDAHGMFYLVHIGTYANNDFIKIRIIYKKFYFFRTREDADMLQ
jgi:hypothetical protein